MTHFARPSGSTGAPFGLSVARLRGKSEMHIKLVVRDGSLREAMIDIELPDTVGGDYLSKLKVKASRERERQTKARALSVQVHKLFNPLEEEVSCKKVAPEGMLIDIAHLIDSKSVEKYQNRYSTAAKQLEELRSGDQRSLASVSLPARQAAHRRRQQLGTYQFCMSKPMARLAMGFLLFVLASRCIEYALLCTRNFRMIVSRFSTATILLLLLTPCASS